MATIRVGSVGVDIVVPLTDSSGNPVDLEKATTMTLYLLPPQPPATEAPIPASAKNATKVGSGKEGQMVYRTQPGDFTQPGDWKAQGRVQYLDPVRDWYTEVYPLIVAPNLDTVGGGVTGTFRETRYLGFAVGQ